jgi:short subunit dehydrogenase-like uncharacterized protein
MKREFLKSGQGHVRPIPGFAEPRFDRCGLFCFTLGPEALHQAEQSPAVFAIPVQILPVDGLGQRSPCLNGMPLKAGIERKVKRPDKKQRKSFSVTIMAEAVNSDSDKVVSKSTTTEGYTLTAMTSLEIVNRVLDEELKIGYRTPAMVYGADFITEYNGIVREGIHSFES